MDGMDKTGEFDFGVAQSILKSNSKRKGEKSEAREDTVTTLKLDTEHPTLDTCKQNWARPGSNRQSLLFPPSPSGPGCESSVLAIDGHAGKSLRQQRLSTTGPRTRFGLRIL